MRTTAKNGWKALSALGLCLAACSGDVDGSPTYDPSGGMAPNMAGVVPTDGVTPTTLPPDGDADGDGIPNSEDPDTIPFVTPTPGATTPGVVDPTTPGTAGPSTTPSTVVPTDPPMSDSGYTPNLDGEPIHARVVRLTHPQWENSVRDLLQLGAVSGLSDSFEGDPPRGTFDNNERALEVTSTLWGDYQRAAETLAEEAAADDARRGAIMDGATTAADFVASFGLKVYRRPLTAEEQQKYVTLYDSATTFFPELDATAAGFRLVVEAMLQSPHFIYRPELGETGTALSSFEIASKLSFLLRNTTPSDELLDAAQAGSLSTPAEVGTWAERMIDEEGMAEVIEGYNTTLFGTQRFDSIVKDTTVFPSFDTSMSSDMREDTDLFLAYIFKNEMGLRELLTSTAGFVNSTTAPLYGVDAPAGATFSQVDLGPERPGLFTRVGFLAYNGTNTQSDPIHRGVDLNHRMLCVSLVAPPGTLPQLPPFDPGQTNRERVAAFTEAEGSTCASCHATFINPLGFAFENFDAIGQLRTTDNGQPVDTRSSYTFATGPAEFDGAKELTDLMAESPQVHACYAEHITEFTLGRDLDNADLPLVVDVMDKSLTSMSIKDMILTIVESDAFVTRQGVTQ